MEKYARNAGKRALQYCAGLKDFDDAVSKLNTLENDLVDPLKNEYVNSYSPKLTETMTGLETGIHYWANSSQQIPKYIASLILSSMQFQIVQIEGFLGHIHVRHNFIYIVLYFL